MGCGEDQTQVKLLLHTELKPLLTQTDGEVASRPTLSPVEYKQAGNETYIKRGRLRQSQNNWGESVDAAFSVKALLDSPAQLIEQL